MSSPATRPVPVTLTVLDSERAPVAAALDLVELSQGQRLRRAFIALGIVWAGAVLSLAVLVAHWVLVPSLLLAGPVVALLTYRTSVRAEVGCRVPCPKCEATFAVESARFGWPLRFDCGRCRAPLQARPRR